MNCQSIYRIMSDSFGCNIWAVPILGHKLFDKLFYFFGVFFFWWEPILNGVFFGVKLYYLRYINVCFPYVSFSSHYY